MMCSQQDMPTLLAAVQDERQEGSDRSEEADFWGRSHDFFFCFFVYAEQEKKKKERKKGWTQMSEYFAEGLDSLFGMFASRRLPGNTWDAQMTRPVRHAATFINVVPLKEFGRREAFNTWHGEKTELFLIETLGTLVPGSTWAIFSSEAFKPESFTLISHHLECYCAMLPS